MSGSAGKRRIAEEQDYPAKSQDSASYSSRFAVVAVCAGLGLALAVMLVLVQVCARSNRRSSEFYGRLAACEADRHVKITQPRGKNLDEDFGEGATLLQNEYCDYEDEGLDSEEEDKVFSRDSPVHT